MLAASPSVVSAEETKTATVKTAPQMHFMRLPPRRTAHAARAQRGHFVALGAVARQPRKTAVIADSKPISAQQPAPGDTHKLLLYVYDEMK